MKDLEWARQLVEAVGTGDDTALPLVHSVALLSIAEDLHALRLMVEAGFQTEKDDYGRLGVYPVRQSRP